MNIKRPSVTQIIWDWACPIGGPTPKTRWRLLAQPLWNGITHHLTNHIDSLHWAFCPASPCSAILPVMRQPQALYGHLVKTRPEFAQDIKFGCHCSAKEHGSFIFKHILQDHGCNYHGWARQWVKFSLKETKLTVKFGYYLAFKILR